MSDMCKRVMKYLSVTLGLLILSTAFASETRIASMGNTGIFVRDDSNLRLFPASLYRYNNQILTELRVKNDVTTFSAGVHLPLGDRAIGALYLNRNLNLPIPANLTTSLGDLQAADFTLGTLIGQNNVGVRVTFAAEDRELGNTDTLALTLDEKARYFELAGGVSSEYYDFGAYFGLPEVESNFGGINRKWSGTGFGVSGRFFLGAPAGIQYVPAVVLNQFSADLTEGNQDINTDFLEFRMGVGIHYQLDTRNLVVLGVEFFGLQRNENDNPNIGKETRTVTNLPAFYLGGETRAKNWLFLRLGATHSFQETQITFRPENQPKTEDTIRDSDFNLAVGVGIMLGKFLLDMDINDNFLFEGPDFISGQGSSEIDDFVNRLSITYRF